MVRTLVLVLLLTSWLLPKAAIAEVTPKVASQALFKVEVRLKPEKVMLGDFVTFVVRGDRIAAAVSKIDFSLFTQDFVIDDIIQDADLLRVRLYPLKTGSLVIPAQKAGFLNVPEFRVEVTPNPDVDIVWKAPPKTAYSQQLVAWNAEVSVSNPAIKVTFEEQSHNQNKGLDVSMSEQSLNRSNIEQSSGVLDAFSDHTHEMVSVYSLPVFYRTRAIEMHSPVVKVKNHTRKRWKFFDAPRQIDVKALPMFLPMSAPIGEIQWQREPLDRIYEAGSLHYWRWFLKADNLSEDYLKGAVYQLVKQLETAENIQFLSENIQASQRFDTRGVVSELEVNLPFRVLGSGWSHIPELNLSFLNPESGLVEQHLVSNHFILGVPSWLMWTLKWVLLLSGLVLSFVVLLAIKQAWLNYYSLQKIRQADDLYMLWNALQTWRYRYDSQLSEHTEFNRLSLGQWQLWYRNLCSVNEQQAEACDKWIHALNQACYADETLDPQAYRRMDIDKMVDEWLRLQPFLPKPCMWLAWIKRRLQR